MNNYNRLLLSVIVLIAIAFFTACPGNAVQVGNSDIQVRVTEKKFLRSTCSDNVSEALSIEIKAILQNSKDVAGYIDDWKIDFYVDGVLLLTVKKSNYEDYACGGQAIDFSEKIETSGYFNYYGFIKYSAFQNTLPNKITVTMTIKENTGYSYNISDTF